MDFDDSSRIKVWLFIHEKHTLWPLIRTAVLTSSQNVCFCMMVLHMNYLTEAVLTKSKIFVLMENLQKLSQILSNQTE